MGLATQQGRAEPPREVALLAQCIREAVVLATGGRVVWASERFAELTGDDSAQALTDLDFEALLQDSGDGLPDEAIRRNVRCRLRRARVPGQGVLVRCAGTTRLSSGERSEIWVVAPDEAGGPQGRSSDDEARRRFELEIDELEAREQGLEKEWDEVCERLAHELRTPLTVVSGHQKLLLSKRLGPLTDGQRSCLTESTLGCKQLDMIVENMLAAGAARRRDELSLELGEASISATIQRVVRFLRPLLDRRGLVVELELSAEGDVGCFDVARIEQVLTNLLTNAIRYTDECSLIEIAARRVFEDGRPMVEVSVGDHGPGIDGADRARVFEPHVRDVQNADAARGGAKTPRVEGVGLGLAICRQIVACHGGTIEVAGATAGEGEDDGDGDGESRREGRSRPRGCRVVFRIPAGGPESHHEVTEPES